MYSRIYKQWILGSSFFIFPNISPGFHVCHAQFPWNKPLLSWLYPDYYLIPLALLQIFFQIFFSLVVILFPLAVLPPDEIKARWDATVASPTHLLCRSRSIGEDTLRFFAVLVTHGKSEEKKREKRPNEETREEESAGAQLGWHFYFCCIYCNLTIAISSFFSLSPTCILLFHFHQFSHLLTASCRWDLFQASDEDTQWQSLQFGVFCILILTSKVIAVIY